MIPQRLRCHLNGRRLLVAAWWLVLTGWLIAADNPLAPFGRLSWLTYDAALQWQQPAHRSDLRIVIVDIDDDSLQAHGRWPWLRDKLAQLITAIRQAEPAMIGLDILLPEPTSPHSDAALAQQLADNNVIAATAFGGLQPPSTPAALPRATRELPPAKTLHANHQPPALGHITPVLEDDGRIRRLYPRILAPDGRQQSSLALAMLERWTGLKAQESATRLCVAGFCRRSPSGHGLLIPYQHPGRFDYISAAQVMAGQHRQRLAQSLVLVGTSAAGLGDLVATPRGALTPGVELHAVQLAGWLDSVAWRPVAHARAWLLAGLALLGIATMPLLGQRSAARWQQWFAISVALGLVATPPLLMLGGWWLAPWAWWASTATMLLIWQGGGRWQLWQRHRRLYRTFGAYVPHSILRQLAENGGEDRFSPKRRPLVILFSDIVGFTALSEQLSPERLARLTQHILTELTEVVHDHEGTLDKYLGDALMAFWGAPLTTERDAELALACALAMQQKLVAINCWAAERGYPPIALHIGMEAGEVTVGNLGSQQRRAYTALGPAVNLAARLEEHAGQIGQPILVGPELAGVLQYHGLAPLNDVQLKGVSRPVTLWRPMSVSGGDIIAE